MEYNCEVYIVDEIMGRGKSIAAINYINSHKDEKILYITPYLDEINNRIIPACRDRNFVTPTDIRGSKTRHIKSLLNSGKNIASTHALFMRFDESIIDICRNQGYTLIMDEVSNVVSEYSISEGDRNTLLEKYTELDCNTNLLKWKNEFSNYRGKFDEEKRLCNLGCLGKYGEDIMIWLFPIQAFNAFNKIFILTYLFNAQIQRNYYDYFKLPYKYLYVKGNNPQTYTFSEEYEPAEKNTDYKNLIHICDNAKLNAIGNLENDLSKNWYRRNCIPGNRKLNNSAMNKLKLNLHNYFNNIMNSKVSNNLWTTFKDFRMNISGSGYASGYVPSNIRATNIYRDRTVIAYPINKYMHTCIKNFFVANNITVDEDGYALSEMLQWIWRSAIRDGKEIYIYIPSRRMRELLQKWIEDNSPMIIDNSPKAK